VLAVVVAAGTTAEAGTKAATKAAARERAMMVMEAEVN
jgi:hypothetical protein